MTSLLGYIGDVGKRLSNGDTEVLPRRQIPDGGQERKLLLANEV